MDCSVGACTPHQPLLAGKQVAYSRVVVFESGARYPEVLDSWFECAFFEIRIHGRRRRKNGPLRAGGDGGGCARSSP